MNAPSMTWTAMILIPPVLMMKKHILGPVIGPCLAIVLVNHVKRVKLTLAPVQYIL